MAFKLPEDWEKDSQTCYVHKTLIRVELMKYKGKEGWCLIPTDLDQPVQEFDPTNEGRDKAFEAFPSLAPPPKKRVVRKKKKKTTKKAAAEEAEEKNDDEDDDS